MNVVHVLSHEIYDSRGWPTVECEIILDNGAHFSAAVPAGASIGSHEAQELRDGNERLFGKGVLKACEEIRIKLTPLVLGAPPNVFSADSKLIELLKSNSIGANSALALSLALAQAEAYMHQCNLFEFISYVMGSKSVTLPNPLFNIINGGAHADNTLRIQEFMIMPIECATFREQMEIAVTIFQSLKEVLRERGYSTLVGDEGGFAPNLSSENEAFELIMLAASRCKLDRKIKIGIDVAASEFYDTEKRVYKWHKKELTASDMIALYEEWSTIYPLFSIEDGLSEDDWEGWMQMYQTLSHKMQIVGDDIFVTSSSRILHGVKAQVASAVIIKPNQVGTFTQTLEAIKTCQSHGLVPLISHRSGETTDTFIADLAVGVKAPQIKAGGLSRGERICKYNRLLSIEDLLLRWLGTSE
jgi:enolase